MRLALFSLFMMPLVVGCDADEGEKPDTGEEADADPDADADADADDDADDATGVLRSVPLPSETEGEPR